MNRCPPACACFASGGQAGFVLERQLARSISRQKRGWRVCDGVFLTLHFLASTFFDGDAGSAARSNIGGV
jgi:hypothetical protein